MRNSNNSDLSTDRSPAKKNTGFIVVFVLACISFLAYALICILFGSTVFQKAETLGEGLGLIFGLILLILPLFVSALFTLAFSIATAFCKLKPIRISSIIFIAVTAISFTTMFLILYFK